MLNFRRRSWQLARCLVTGASSGLGEALAEQLVKAGARVVLTGRSAKRLQAIADRLIDEGSDPSRIVTIAADLTVEEDCQRLFDEIAGHFEGLDLVINSAGVGADGQFETHDPAVIRQVFEINVFALAEVCRRALPLLSQGIEPAMVNIGSIVARRGLPGRVEYSASKFAVSGFTEALRVEWRRFGIHVLQVNPGFTDTPFDQHIVASTARVAGRRCPSDPPRRRATKARDHAELARPAPGSGQYHRSAVCGLGLHALAAQLLPRRSRTPA
jgi:NAD(P)-dependent dehydrogenase (short-subunit alcohol dehydrogenase family)